MPRRKQDLEQTPQLPEFVPYQHPKLMDRLPGGPGWRYEVKLDGYRMQLRVLGGRVSWRTRNGLDWTPRFADVSADLSNLPDCLMDGELVVLGEDGQPNFSALRSAMGKRQAGSMEGELTYFAFDLLYEGTDDLRPYSLESRKSRLRAVLEAGGEPVGRWVREIRALPPEAPGALLKAACEMGLEGIVAKRLDKRYDASAIRSDTWQKVKCRPLTEVVVVGWRAEGPVFKSLLGGVYENGALRYAGSIKTGFGGRTLDELMPRLRELEVDHSPLPYAERPRKQGIHWTRPELVARVEVADWTASGKVRQASFQGLRDDKQPEEVVG